MKYLSQKNPVFLSMSKNISFCFISVNDIYFIFFDTNFNNYLCSMFNTE